MKVLYVCADLGIPIGGHKGASAHIRGFAEGLSKLGHEVKILSPVGDAKNSNHIMVPRSDLFIKDAYTLPKKMARALRHISANSPVEHSVHKACSDFRPDLIYERHSPFAVAGGLVAKKLGIRHILEVNSPLSREGETYRAQALPDVAKSLELQAFAAAGEIVVVSSELQSELKAMGVPADKLHVLPNGVDIASFSKAYKSDAHIKSNSDTLTLGFVGSLKPWHDVSGLLSIFQSLAEDSSYEFLVVGDGPEAYKLKGFADENPQRVTLTGALNHAEVPDYLAQIDIALAPYPQMDDFYFSPLKVLEYMASGRAIVASNIGQIKSLITHGETGLLCRPGDHGGMAAAVRRLRDEVALRERLAENAFREANAHHDWKHRVKDVLAIAENMRSEA